MIKMKSCCYDNFEQDDNIACLTIPQIRLELLINISQTRIHSSKHGLNIDDSSEELPWRI